MEKGFDTVPCACQICAVSASFVSIVPGGEIIVNLDAKAALNSLKECSVCSICPLNQCSIKQCMRTISRRQASSTGLHTYTVY